MTFAILLFTGQLVSGLTGHDHWPFASYGMFSFDLPLAHTVLRVQLLRRDRLLDDVPAAQTLPVEFFRANAMYRYILMEDDPSRCARFFHYILGLLNHDRWPAFDERYAAPAGAGHLRYTRIRVLLASETLSMDRGPHLSLLVPKNVLYDSDRTAARDEQAVCR
jgi:hypothetical protein